MFKYEDNESRTVQENSGCLADGPKRAASKQKSGVEGEPLGDEELAGFLLKYKSCQLVSSHSSHGGELKGNTRAPKAPNLGA